MTVTDATRLVHPAPPVASDSDAETARAVWPSRPRLAGARARGKRLAR
ncbi:hypothetical protein [Rubrivirga sp. IMCC43871]